MNDQLVWLDICDLVWLCKVLMRPVVSSGLSV